MRIFIFLLLLAAPAQVRAAAEIGVGAGGVGFGGFGALTYYQPEDSRWRLGAEYSAISSVSRSPYTGRVLTRDRSTMAGFFAHRQFTPGKQGRWYLGAALLFWTHREKAEYTGEVSTDSDLSPYFGIGWLRRYGSSVFLDIGVLSSPWARLDTATSVSSSQDRGAADLHLVLGARF